MSQYDGINECSYIPDRGLEHRCHMCLVHTAFHLRLDPSADSTPWSQQHDRRAYIDPSSELWRHHQETISENWWHHYESKMCVRGQRSLTAAVFRHPAHRRWQSVDVKVFPVELRTLFLSEVSLTAGTRVCVTRAKLHPAAHTKTPSVPRPENTRERWHQHQHWYTAQLILVMNIWSSQMLIEGFVMQSQL